MLILSWLRGRTTEQEDRELCEWVEADPRNLEYFSQIRAVDSFLKYHQGGAIDQIREIPYLEETGVGYGGCSCGAFRDSGHGEVCHLAGSCPRDGHVQQ